jgi:uncharacterized protein
VEEVKTSLPKFLAVAEVCVVTFGMVPLLPLGIYRFWPRFETWQTNTSGFTFPVFLDVIMVGLSLVMILLRGKRPAEYGLRFTPVGYHLSVGATCFLPFILASLPIGLGLNYTTWSGALILAVMQIGLLFVLAFLLKKKPSTPGAEIAAAGMILLLPAGSSGPTLQKALAIFLSYALFVGFGEEILYRGYVLSRLNEVFGRPYQFFGVQFGWGMIIAALIFGLTHTGLIGFALGLSLKLTPAYGIWTFFGGLVFGFVREKTGSIFAPALLHGLPQAIASEAMLFLP